MSIKNKTIGILTLQNANNFGALLQAYALKSYLLNNFNCKVFIVNHDWSKEPLNFHKIIKNPFAFLKKIFLYNSIKKRIKKSSKSLNIEGFGNVFQDFRDNHLNITKEEYSYTSLCMKPPEADIFIVGSDQVWAVDFLFKSRTYLLEFVGDGVKKISYAPSFGKAELESYLKPILAKSLRKFDSISIREKSGKNIIESLLEKNIAKVVDPTLLLTKEGYLSLIEPAKIEDSYIFVYLLDQEESLYKWSEEVVNFLADYHSLRVIYVSTNNINEIPDHWETFYPSPEEFLGLIDASSLVITNSFHGTVFSILFEKQFHALPRDHYKNKQNLRITDLLKIIELENRFIEPYSSKTNIEQIKINYIKVKEKLDVQRTYSQEFLQTAINS